jgi:hypothetical protein
MTETDRDEPQMYQPRAVLRGISPLIWRRLLCRECAVYRDGGGMIGIDARCNSNPDRRSRSEFAGVTKYHRDLPGCCRIPTPTGVQQLAEVRGRFAGGSA